MILWHLGMTVLIVRYVFRDPRMDLRWVLAGSILPDLIDKPFGSILFNETFRTHRLWAHSLLFPVVGLTIVMVATRRGGDHRKQWIGLVIGLFVHLLLDGVWLSPEAFLWPLFGLDFPKVAGSDFPALLRGMLSSPLVWLGEAVGAGYLVLLWRRHLAGAGGIRGFFDDGRIALS